MAEINIDRVWKYYGKTVAVRDLTLNCADGEFLSVLGPSGCGKSSTLRMLAGLEHITAGEIRFAGKRVNDLPPKDRDIAMVFENYALYPHRTVYNNIANALRLRRMPQAEIDKRVRRAAEMLEIGRLLDRRPHELSGGQKQRVAIGRAIVREPQLFLFDEPIAHLDAKLRAHMRGELKHLQRTLGTSMIYVTHDQLEALSMADKIAVMHNGVLQQYGTPADIYNHPVNEWVAGFVGEPPMNFVDCELAGAGGDICVTHPSFSVPVTPEQRARLSDTTAGPVRLGIRPDDVTVAMERGPETPIEAKVFITEPIGGDMLVDTQLADGRRLLVRTKPGFSGRAGDTCWLGFNTSRWHLFSSADGRAYF